MEEVSKALTGKEVEVGAFDVGGRLQDRIKGSVGGADPGVGERREGGVGGTSGPREV